MKNSKDYSQKLQKMFRAWEKAYPKVQNVSYDEPVDALVYAIIYEKLTEAESRAALKKFADYFVDWNDLRVSRPEEIIEMLGHDSPQTREIAASLNDALMAVFDKYNLISLESLKKLGKKPAKQILERLKGTSKFIVDFCMLTAFKAHAIPLTQRMIDFLKEQELVDHEADVDQIEGFLARQIPAKKAYEFYELLRAESESRKKQKKTTEKKTTANQKVIAEVNQKEDH